MSVNLFLSSVFLGVSITVTGTQPEYACTFLFCGVCVSVSNVIPVGLDEDHELVKQFTQSCGDQNANGWITRSE